MVTQGTEARRFTGIDAAKAFIAEVYPPAHNARFAGPLGEPCRSCWWHRPWLRSGRASAALPTRQTGCRPSRLLKKVSRVALRMASSPLWYANVISIARRRAIRRVRCR
jgi:hypothetical protein